MFHTDQILARADLLPPAFTCTATHGGLDAAWVHLTGELDITTAPELRRTLHESQLQARLTVLDLRDVAFIDCAGVRTIVDASLRARKAGRRLILVRGGSEIYRVFRLTGCSEDVDIGDPDSRSCTLSARPSARSSRAVSSSAVEVLLG